MKIQQNIREYILLRNLSIIIFLLLLPTCCLVNASLTGGTIDPRAKTIYISSFPNNSALVNPTLSQELTTAVKNKIQRQTPLTIINQNSGDYTLEGEIVNYTIAPIAIQGNETAAMNRLTITIRVRFNNKFDEKSNFDQTFSRYADYNSTSNFTAIESNLITEINEALTEDIFNKAFVNW